MPDGRSSNPKGDDLHEVDGWARKEPHFSKNQVQILTSPPRPRTFPEIEPYVLLLGARERERIILVYLSTYVTAKPLEFELLLFFTRPSLLIYDLKL